MAGKTTLLAVVTAALLANAGATLAATAPETPTESRRNFLDIRQYRMENARIPGTSIRQNMTAWTVSQGTWNGQTLDGLSLVLVEQASSDGRGAKTVVCYVNDFSTPAQREALISALAASQAPVFGARDVSTMRVEPAVIRVEIEGGVVVIHLGLIA